MRHDSVRLTVQRFLPILALTAVLCPAAAQARPHGGDVGVGLVAGQPTGITVQFRQSQSTALNLAVGFNVFEGRGGYLHLDYTVSPFVIGGSRNLVIPFYLGVGGFIAGHSGAVPQHGDLFFGVRAPFGLMFEFSAPVHIFAEIAANLIFDAGGGGSYFDFGGALGFRVFF